MSLENTLSVDYVSTNADYVRCSIVDDWNWNDVKKHLAVLQEKLNNYLMFIESGQLLTSYPNAKGKKIVISIFFKEVLTKETESFLSFVEKRLTSSGYKLEYASGFHL
ncbi:MAG: hypothetical protein LBJ11_00100 [Oscillospiraceae bacterium]|jgi:hypothetical protein|nr:hypothetical protein [Oscillospiraceae bacterium]